MTDLAKLTDALLSAAQKAGADSADALATHGTSVTINVLNGALEQAERAEGTDIGLRVLVGKRQACVSASDTSADTITTMAERAVAMARLAPEDPYIGLADPDQIAKNWDVASLDLAEDAPEPSAEHFKDVALEAEAAALSHKGITQADSVTAGYGRSAMHLAATNGFSGGYARTSHGLSCVAITGTGTEMERDYYGDSRSHAADMMSPTEIGNIAAERTLERAGAVKPPTGTYPVIYDERVSSGLIGHLLQAANGASIARGGSWLRDRLGDQVLPNGITLTEDPHRPRIRGSKPFDAEGLATRSRNIVEDGVLMGWTLDLANARKLGMESTASAARGTGGPPNPTVGNVSMTQGDKSRDELLRDMGTGLLVTGLIGSTINPTTGDYSRGASGFWIENGQIAYPVTECTIASNLHEMLATLIPANDARAHLSRVVPSILVESMTIAGA